MSIRLEKRFQISRTVRVSPIIVELTAEGARKNIANSPTALRKSHTMKTPMTKSGNG